MVTKKLLKNFSINRVSEELFTDIQETVNSFVDLSLNKDVIEVCTSGRVFYIGDRDSVLCIQSYLMVKEFPADCFECDYTAGKKGDCMLIVNF